jgi:hypothetical protein
MDGPGKRIRAARELWDKGYKEDAAALIFIATAAVSRLRYPRDCGYSDKVAFTAFVSDEIATITNGATQKPLRFPKTTKLPEINVTENVPLEDVFYGAWRCVMIHEARWPSEVYLTESRTDNKYRTSIEMPPDGRLGLPEEWILGLAFAVEHAAEIVLPKIVRFPIYCVFSGPVKDLGSNLFQIMNGETKAPRVNVRSQHAVPIFSDEGAMKAFTKYYNIPNLFVGLLSDKESLRRFIEQGGEDERFIFNPIPEQKLPPSYSRESLLKHLGSS